MSHLVLLLHFLYQLPTFLPTAGVVRGEDNKETLPSLHVLLSHYAQLLLPGGVEDVQQTDLTINNQLLPVACSCPLWWARSRTGNSFEGAV